MTTVHASRLMRSTVLIAAMMLSSNLVFAQNAYKIYRCIAKDAITLQDDGSLGGREFSKKARSSYFRPFMIDTLTGAISYSDGTRVIWRIIQKGNSENDHVLTDPHPLIPENPERAALAGAATDFIRLRDWPENPRVTFLAFSLSTFVSGTCEVVPP